MHDTSEHVEMEEMFSSTQRMLRILTPFMDAEICRILPIPFNAMMCRAI
jgi:hypothetical protein